MKTIKLDISAFYWKPYLGWLGVLLIYAVGTRFSPMLRPFGFEYSMFGALFVSLATAHIAALYPSRVRAQLAPFPGASRPIFTLFVRVLVLTLPFLALLLLVALATRLFVQPCHPTRGFEFFLLLPIPATLLAAAVGLAWGLFWPGKLAPSLLAIGTVLASVWLAFVEFHQSPAVFLFGPFFGYFPGVLYDEALTVDHRLWVYRVITLVQTGAVLAAMALFLDKSELRLTASSARGRRKLGVAAFILCSLTLGAYLLHPSLGIRTRSADLKNLLSRHVATGPLDLYFPPTTDYDLVDRLTIDAAHNLKAVGEYFNVPIERRISVYFFQNRGQKARAMGASRTNVAKPWRREVYVLLEDVPHRVLRHELVHAVAAQFGRGPFRIAGAYGGLLPNPGLIEGLAMAAGSPRVDMTIHEWTKGMQQNGLLQPLSKIFGFGFLGLHAATAYNAAGSFCAWFHDSFGPEALRKVYGGASFGETVGSSLADLEKLWHQHLATIELNPRERAAAEHRFDRPAVVKKSCVHEVAKLSKEARKTRKSGDFDAAINNLETALSISDGSLTIKLRLLATLVEAGRLDESETLLEVMLQGEKLNLAQRLSLKETRQDIKARGRIRPALAPTYQQLATQAPSRDHRRRLFVKGHLSATGDASLSPILTALSKHPREKQVSPTVMALNVSAAAHQTPEDPVILYLLARQYYLGDDYRSAIAQINEAIKLNLREVSADLYLESILMRAKAQFMLKRYRACQETYGKIAANAGLPKAIREYADDAKTRCRFAATLRNVSQHTISPLLRSAGSFSLKRI